MNLSPFLAAPTVIQVHAVFALFALGLGTSQLLMSKGSSRHRVVGWIWVGAMTVVSITAFFIHEIRLWGPWSPIHILAAITLVNLAAGVITARRGDVTRHKRIMLLLFALALVVTGIFTLLPGRLMHTVAFG